MVESVNSCRFVGKLVDYKLYTGAEYVFGRGSLRLCDAENPGFYQEIKIISFNKIAERIGEITIGQWIEVLSVYSPNLFRGVLQDQFNVVALRKIEEGKV